MLHARQRPLSCDTVRCPGSGEASFAVALLLLALATVVFCWPFLTGNALPRGSDLTFAAQWTRGFADGLAEGRLYPRWISDSNRGFGAPTFLLYPPLAYGLSGLVRQVGFDVAEALRIVMVAVSFLSGLAFFVAFRPVTSTRAALAGAILYVWLPYRALDLYERFAFAELVALTWAPLFFAAVRSLGARLSASGWLALVLSGAALLLTHPPTAGLSILFAAPFALAVIGGPERARRLAPVLAGGGVALLLASIYLVPLLLHRELVHFERLSEPWWHWRNNFIDLDKSLPGFSPDRVVPWVRGAVVTQGLVALVAWLALRLSGAFERIPGNVRPEVWAWAGVFCAALVLQTSWSAPAWQWIPGLPAVQFPWRAGFLQGLAAAALFTFAYDVTTRSVCFSAPTRVGLALACIPAIAFGVAVRSARPLDFDDDAARSARVRHRVVLEHVPRGVSGWKELPRAPYPPEVPTPASMIRIAGDASALILEWSNHTKRLRIDATTPSLVRVRTFHYPGWSARIDGRPAPIRDENRLRAIEISVGPGRHDVELTFAAAPGERSGALLTASGLVLLLAGAAFIRWRGPEPPPASRAG